MAASNSRPVSRLTAYETSTGPPECPHRDDLFGELAARERRPVARPAEVLADTAQESPERLAPAVEAPDDGQCHSESDDRLHSVADYLANLSGWSFRIAFGCRAVTGTQ